MRIHIKLATMFSLILVFTLSGCASKGGLSADKAEQDPNTRINKILIAYQAELKEGSSCRVATQAWSETIDCEGLLREAMALYAAFPNNERVKLATAAMLYQSGRPIDAAYLLDQILKYHQPRPEAAILRSRIAIEDGNLAFAKKLIDEQIQLNPTYHDLHEVLASIYFLKRNYAQSFNTLIRSEQLGAPSWRVSYHRGLIFEKQGKLEAACQQYFSSVSQNPEFAAPEGRIIGLSHLPACHRLAVFVGG